MTNKKGKKFSKKKKKSISPMPVEQVIFDILSNHDTVIVSDGNFFDLRISHVPALVENCKDVAIHKLWAKITHNKVMRKAALLLKGAGILVTPTPPRVTDGSADASVARAAAYRSGIYDGLEFSKITTENRKLYKLKRGKTAANATKSLVDTWVFEILHGHATVQDVKGIPEEKAILAQLPPPEQVNLLT